jgi:mono/diheme cytochrome c family protein
LACRSCHTPSASGFSGLTGIASKVRRDWLIDFLTDPARSQPGTPMRAYPLTAYQIADLTAFLLGDDSNSQAAPSPPTIEPNATTVMEGQAEFERLSCASCHRLEGVAEPRLSGLPLSSDNVASKLMARSSFSGSEMPAFHLSWKDATSIELAIRNPQ